VRDSIGWLRRRNRSSGPPISIRSLRPLDGAGDAPESQVAADSPLEEDGFEPSVPGESNGQKANEPVSLLERKVPEMSSTGRRLSIFTSGFSRDYKLAFQFVAARVPND
jgi:hypothetical protein